MPRRELADSLEVILDVIRSSPHAECNLELSDRRSRGNLDSDHHVSMHRLYHVVGILLQLNRSSDLKTAAAGLQLTTSLHIAAVREC
jgi:hypothetical protein